MKLTAFHIEYDALTIPPQATSKFTGNCSVASAVSMGQGTPFALLPDDVLMAAIAPQDVNLGQREAL